MTSAGSPAKPESPAVSSVSCRRQQFRLLLHKYNDFSLFWQEEISPFSREYSQDDSGFGQIGNCNAQCECISEL